MEYDLFKYLKDGDYYFIISNELFEAMKCADEPFSEMRKNISMLIPLYFVFRSPLCEASGLTIRISDIYEPLHELTEPEKVFGPYKLKGDSDPFM
jgi:hypothetical protein